MAQESASSDTFVLEIGWFVAFFKRAIHYLVSLFWWGLFAWSGFLTLKDKKGALVLQCRQEHLGIRILLLWAIKCPLGVCPEVSRLWSDTSELAKTQGLYRNSTKCLWLELELFLLQNKKPGEGSGRNQPDGHLTQIPWIPWGHLALAAGLVGADMKRVSTLFNGQGDRKCPSEHLEGQFLLPVSCGCGGDGTKDLLLPGPGKSQQKPLGLGNFQLWVQLQWMFVFPS